MENSTWNSISIILLGIAMIITSLTIFQMKKEINSITEVVSLQIEIIATLADKIK